MAQYPFPWQLFFLLARDLPKGQRSFASDAMDMVRRMRPSPCVRGLANVPARGPVALVANHYQRRGLWIAWPGAVVTAALWERRGQDPPVRWLVTGGLRLLQWKRTGPEVVPVRVILQAVARTYGMAALPLSGASGRGRVLRRWMAWAEQGDAIGIFPEGLDGTSECLRRPEPGFETVCRLLTGRKIPIVPCGIWEDGGILHVAFGLPVEPETARSEGAMRAIAALLPESQRGEYAASVQSDRKESTSDEPAVAGDLGPEAINGALE